MKFIPRYKELCPIYVTELFQYFLLAFMAHRGTNLVLVSYVNKPGYVASCSHNKMNLEPVFLCRISGLRGQCLRKGFLHYLALGFLTFRKTVLPSDTFYFLPVTWHPPEPDLLT
jgi:hypothetical protein